MSDLSAYEAASQPRRMQCTVKTILESLKGKALVDLKGALAAPHVTHQGISVVLGQLGHKVDAQTVSRHRRNLCGCKDA